MKRFFKKVLRKHRQIDFPTLNSNLIWLANDEDHHTDYLGTDDPSIDAQKLKQFCEIISLIRNRIYFLNPILIISPLKLDYPCRIRTFS